MNIYDDVDGRLSSKRRIRGKALDPITAGTPMGGMTDLGALKAVPRLVLIQAGRFGAVSLQGNIFVRFGIVLLHVASGSPNDDPALSPVEVLDEGAIIGQDDGTAEFLVVFKISIMSRDPVVEGLETG